MKMALSRSTTWINIIKNHILTLVVVFSTVLLTLWIFFDFQTQWQATETLHAIVNDAPLSVRQLFIAPEQLGVKAWESGESGVYQLKTNAGCKQVSFHVMDKAESLLNDEFWLKTQGLARHDEMDIEIWRLLNLKSLRPGSERTGLIFVKGAIPFSVQQHRPLPYRVALEHVGNEDVETEIGVFECRHYLARLQSPDGSYVPLLELWANSTVSPLGIVRARWRDQVLELIETQERPTPENPEMLSKTIQATKSGAYDGIKVSDSTVSVCAHCHETEKGGKSLKQETLTALSGTAFAIPQVFYHHYAAKLLQPHDRLWLQLISHRGKRLAFQPVRFTWEKGSFRVQTDTAGRLVLLLDKIGHQSNIHVASEKGRLFLDAFREDL